jgi:hypothetical protein
MDHRYNDTTGELEEFDNGPYEDERKLDPGTAIAQHWTRAEAEARDEIVRRYYGDVLNAKMGGPPVPCPNRNAEDPTGAEPFKGTLHCPCCQRELCTVSSESAMVHVTKPCDGCQREGRTVTADQHQARLDLLAELGTDDITPEDLEAARAEREGREGWMGAAEDMRLAEQIMDDVDGSRQSGLRKAASRIAKYRKLAALRALLDEGADSPVAPPGTFDRVMKRLSKDKP